MEHVSLVLKHDFDPERCRHSLGGTQIVFHCHHYITLSLRLAQELGFADGRQIMRDSTEDAIAPVLRKIFADHGAVDTQTRLSLASQYFSYIGLGKMEVEEATPDGGILRFPYSHVDQGWVAKWGRSEEPINYVAEGFASALFASVFDQPPRSYMAKQNGSIAMGHDETVVETRRSEPSETKSYPIAPHRVTSAKLATMASGIDRQAVINSLSPLVSQVKGNEEGLIPAFGVLVNILPTSFWNTFAFRVMEAARGTGETEIVEAGRFLLRQCAHECGFHTGYGIITSPEWGAAVAPMIRKEAALEDTLHGAYAVFAAWGWANAGIKQLIPAEKMVLEAIDCYEADGAPNEPSAFMMQGVAAGFMDLAYGGGYPKGLGAFIGVQTKGIECGDESTIVEVSEATGRLY